MYKTAYFCVNCGTEVSRHQKMFSVGRCPYCGYKSRVLPSIMQTLELGYKIERLHPWWKLWQKNRTRRVFVSGE